MPAPSNPPPADEAGALLSPRQLNRWLDVNPVHPLTRTQTYLTVPLFSVDVQWKGYSELIAAYNFTSARNFTLPRFTPPLNPDYVLCISWVDSDNNMHRYKLWEDVGEVFYFPVTLYSGQLIKKNFRFEVWSISPVNVLSFGIAGAGIAGANRVYTYDTGIVWEGDAGHEITHSGDNWRLDIFADATYYFTTSPNTPPAPAIWTPFDVFALAPMPYAYVDATVSQATNLTFYTSVRGGKDYMWAEDTALSSPSALITDFNIIDNNAPWTAPSNSTSTVNL